MKPLCIYHANCADGFGAAWAVRHALPETEFHAGFYDKPPPDVTDRTVIMVDFSYKRPVIEEMAKTARMITIHDHHKGAAEELAGYPDMPPQSAWADITHPEKIYASFDMERSGAGLAWDYFHPGEARPALINHIEDRDLWRFALPGSREIHAAIMSHPMTFEVWDSLMDMSTWCLVDEGRGILRAHDKQVREIIALNARRMAIGEHMVWIANASHHFASDIGHELCRKEHAGPFAATYWDTSEGRSFSLRSDGAADVSEIAKSFGGGGHATAAGFTVPRDHPLALA